MTELWYYSDLDHAPNDNFEQDGRGIGSQPRGDNPAMPPFSGDAESDIDDRSGESA